ncbi:inorganic polyphosphate/ATP-NAD kinase [Pseudomonas aeruginosa]|nr:inorganic polyphosphate/ATP-NAD kinase [Pseudomonas aeruginosa]
MEPFRNIGIIGRLGSTQVLDTIRRLKKFLIDRHLHVILEDTIAEVLPGHGLQTCSRKIMGEICDLVVVVGGDGSMLGAARALARHKVPVLGINRGSLGFLTDIRPDELEPRSARCWTASTSSRAASSSMPRCVAVSTRWGRAMRSTTWSCTRASRPG